MMNDHTTEIKQLDQPVGQEALTIGDKGTCNIPITQYTQNQEDKNEESKTN